MMRVRKAVFRSLAVNDGPRKTEILTWIIALVIKPKSCEGNILVQ